VTLDSGSITVREQPLTTNVTVVTRIGRTNAATLTINGGLMDVTQLLVGETPGAQYARSQGTVHLAGGTLSVAAELSIGTGLGCTGMVDVAGGQLLVANQQTNVMRIGDQGFGQMTVVNGSAHVGNVSVARHDSSRGLLVLQPGGLMTCSDDCSIGRFSGSTGLVFVAGGELAVTNHPIWVGREGRGQLVVSNGLVQAETLNVAVVPTNTAFGLLTVGGGTILVSSNFVLGDEALSVGQALVADGNLSITNGTGTAQLTINSGVFTLNGGELAADHLALENAAGRFVFNGGNLRSSGTTVSNGLPFVVGDGIKPATFHLNGGVHSFANGLVISSNATLSGCGVINGSIVNHGTLIPAADRSPRRRLARPVLTAAPRVLLSTARTATPTSSNTKNTLEAPDWLRAASANGTGGPLTLTDPTANRPRCGLSPARGVTPADPPMPTRLIVVRHAETVWNVEGRRQGHADSPLTSRGVAQAEAVARRLAELEASALLQQ